MARSPSSSPRPSPAMPCCTRGMAACPGGAEGPPPLPIRDVLAPAVALAKRGLPQDWYTTLKIASSASVLRLYPESARIYLPNGLPPIAPYQGKPGFLAQGALPATLERLQQAGLRDFYQGEVAAQIIADMKTVGGVLTAADLAGCRARVLPSV